MALSNAERQKRYRERMKARAESGGVSLTDFHAAILVTHKEWWDKHGYGKAANEDGSAEGDAADDVDQFVKAVNGAIDRWIRDCGYHMADTEVEHAIVRMAKSFYVT